MDEEIRQLLASLQIDGYAESLKRRDVHTVEKPRVHPSRKSASWVVAVLFCLCVVLAGGLFFWKRGTMPRQAVHFYDAPHIAVSSAALSPPVRQLWSTNNLEGDILAPTSDCAYVAKKRVLDLLHADIDHLVESLACATDTTTQEALSEAIDQLQHVERQVTKQLIQSVALVRKDSGTSV